MSFRRLFLKFKASLQDRWRTVQIKRNIWRQAMPRLLVVIPLAFLPDLKWEVVAGQRSNLNALAWETQFAMSQTAEIVHASDAESLLREAHRLLSIGQRDQALSVSQEMVTRYPHFQLGQLLFADLLNLISDRPFDAHATLNFDAPDVSNKLQQLNSEARQRLTRPDASVYAGKEPAGLVYVSARIPFVIVVDASHSRLYVMAHAKSNETEKLGRGMSVIFESYMSVGQRGVGKQKKGDGKTPLGAYFIQKSYPGYALPDLYGSGALTLNYPNDLDILDGKTGSGIWLHGSPSQQYARAPEASDGCVVLSNPDMAYLMQLQLPAGTPVFIQRKIEWVEPQKNENLRKKLWSSLPQGQGLSQDEVLTVLSWQGEDRKMMAVMSGAETQSLVRASRAKSNYWIEQSQQWHPVSAKSSDTARAERHSAVALSERTFDALQMSSVHQGQPDQGINTAP